MKIFIFLLMFFTVSNCYAETYSAKLFYYPSYKYAEMSGGYPFKQNVELVIDDNVYTLNMNDKKYSISLYEHVSCDCDFIDFDEFRFPAKEVYVFFDGHYCQIKFKND